MASCSHDSYRREGNTFRCNQCGEEVKVTQKSTGEVVVETVRAYAIVHTIIDILSAILGG